MLSWPNAQKDTTSTCLLLQRDGNWRTSVALVGTTAHARISSSPDTGGILPSCFPSPMGPMDSWHPCGSVWNPLSRSGWGYVPSQPYQHCHGPPGDLPAGMAHSAVGRYVYYNPSCWRPSSFLTTFLMPRTSTRRDPALVLAPRALPQKNAFHSCCQVCIVDVFYVFTWAILSE